MNREKLWKQLIDDDETEGALPVPRAFAGVSRRRFLEVLGYSTAAVALTSCRAPEQKIVPSLRQSVEFTPGVANWYASVCGGCSAGCGTLVKVRDGRPIKIEGNPDHPVSAGGLCAVAHAMVFGLYGPERIRQPFIGQHAASWPEVDAELKQKFGGIREAGGKVVLVSPLLNSPASEQLAQQFLAAFRNAQMVTYEPVSTSAIRAAHLKSHGRAFLPAYDFSQARLVVSFSADFLGTWVNPVQQARGYAAARNLQDGKREMARHVQFEARVSLTGTNADRRYSVTLAEERDALLYLARVVAEACNAKELSESLASFSPNALSAALRSEVEALGKDLARNRGASLIVGGTNAPRMQYVLNCANEALGNYGKTVRIGGNPPAGAATDDGMAALVRDMNAGEVAAVILLNSNPAYNYFDAEEFRKGLGRVPLKISLTSVADETAALVDYVCPTHHFLESWNDVEAVPGTFSIAQPAIAPLFQTRAWQESLLRWNGDTRSFHDILRQRWREQMFSLQQKETSFDAFWDGVLQAGAFTALAKEAAPQFSTAETRQTVSDLLQRFAAAGTRPDLALVLYESTALRDGRFANSPWLLELPDPVTRISWDNYASVSPRTAHDLGLADGDVVWLRRGDLSLETPAHIQVGQADGTVAVALGYGRSVAKLAGNGVGANAYRFVRGELGTFRYLSDGVTLTKTGRRTEFARIQSKDTTEGRPIARSMSLAAYAHGEAEHEAEHESLWSPHDFPEHKWGIAVDLSACIGCAACVLSCQAENNIPVVGREEMRRNREMHWLRIDRYYSGDGDDLQVTYQPLMCAQCDNASCESVCPVLATVHSSEGLNMQVYNRCVGTRYCENNCPYKVRRFNWFYYPHDDPAANLALNPDVTVRSRGVMEKCTFCVQRIEEAKIHARNEGRQIADGEIQPACQQSCPTSAIIFGDLKDVRSRVNQLRQSGRSYTLLDELNLRPATSYLARVRNRDEVPEG